MENSCRGHTIKDILSQSNSFLSISFAHVDRQGNVVAHALAQRARQYFSSQIWLECVPTDILSFVLDDFSFSLSIYQQVFTSQKKKTSTLSTTSLLFISAFSLPFSCKVRKGMKEH